MSTFTDPIRALYVDWSARMQADPQMSLPTMRDLQEGWHSVSTEPSGVTYESVDVDGLPAIWCIPANADPTTAVLYFHGGGFIVGSTNSHRKLAGHLANAIAAKVLLLDYRRAPEDLYPAQVDDGEQAFRWLIAAGYEPARIISAGDSAGGTLALALVVSLREHDEPLPGAVLTYSPGLDWEGSWMANEDNDILATKAVITTMGSIAFGGRSTMDPLCNPLYADLAGFPPVYIAAGGHENLLGGAQQFVKAAEAAGVDVTLDVADGRQHVYQFAAGNDPEADRTIAESAAWVRQRLAPTSHTGQAPAHQARRVVTGHDAQGRSIIASDSIVEAFEASPTTFATRLWATDTFPSDNADERDGAQLIQTFAAENGDAFYIVDWAPNSLFPPHRTLSIDYGVVLSGELEAVLDSGEVAHLNAGDSIVQRGTMHSWRNPTDEWTRTVFVLAAAGKLVVAGEPIEPTM